MASGGKYLVNTVWAPTSVTRAESFIWYRAHSRLQLGVAFLWKQTAFRFLVSAQIIQETTKYPAVNASAGIQGIGTGNPGYSVTLEKNFDPDGHRVNAFVGIGFRANENHSHGVGGVKVSLNANWTVVYQHDGHQQNPFITYGKGQAFGGIYLLDFERPALMFGFRF